MGNKVSDNIAAMLAMVEAAEQAQAAPPSAAASTGGAWDGSNNAPAKATRKGDSSKASMDGSGHRERLRGRLLNNGATALADHELIECLLMFARPRVDTKPTAKELLREFGTIDRLLAANADALLAQAGVGESSAALIKLVHALTQRALLVKTRDQPVLANWQALLDYLRSDMGSLIHERVRVLYLDSRNRLIKDHLMSDGSVDQSAIYVREVVKRALDVGATSLILVHNHPSGDPSPSRQDIAITRDIVEACKRFSIAVHDHIIIAADRHISLKAQGLI